MNVTPSLEIEIAGMDCGHCAATIQRQLEQRGFQGVFVNFATSRASIPAEYRPKLAELADSVRELGYQVNLPGETTTHPRWRSLEAKFLFSLPFTLALMAPMVWPAPLLHDPLVQLALCVPVYLLGAAHFGRSALSSLRVGSPNMDVLIFVGITASFFYSFWGTLAQLGPNFLFYETSASITTIVLLGNLMESRSVRRTASALDELARMQPPTAIRLDPQAPEQEGKRVAASDLRAGDLVLVNDGDRIPADGTVRWGNASADESMISGESRPVEKTPGSFVVAGSVVAHGTLKIEVSAIGSGTVLSSIIDMVRRAQQAKPNIQRIGDVVSSYFVAIVCMIALGTFGVSLTLLDVSFQDALLRSIAVLVIACPCAMGLATPTAVMVGLGRAAREGVLLRSGAVAEALAGIRVLAFDKTGTLTTGRFDLDELAVSDPREEELVRQYIRSLEQHSSHPLARSLREAIGPGRLVPFRSVTEIKGSGLHGIDEEGRDIRFGSRRIAPPGAAIPTHLHDFDLFLFQGERCMAAVRTRDTIRRGAREVMRVLRKLGISPVLISGDAKSACEAVGQALDIPSVHFEQLPGEKLELIRIYQSGASTAFCGDGINDAPALARASVGISLADATDVAVSSSEVVILGDDLRRLVFALWISRATLGTIRLNLFWAFFYNSAAIPLAAAGYLSPTIAAITMGLSDVIIIWNSLLLRYRKPPTNILS